MIASLLALACAPAPQDWTPPPPPAVIPSPALSQPRYAPFVVPDALRVVTAEESREALAPVVAEHLARLLERDVVIGAPPSRSGDVVLTLGYLADQVAENGEALSVEVFADHVALSGSTPAGVARAAARLFQLFEKDAESGAWSLPPVRIDDAPAYPVRGIVVPQEQSSLIPVHRAVDLAFLGSMNLVIARGDWLTKTHDCTGGPMDSEKLQQYARDRGVELVFESAEEEAKRPRALGPDDDLAAHVEASGFWIDATAPVLLASVSRTFDEADRARAFAWSPAARIDALADDLRGEARAKLRGAVVRFEFEGKGSAYVQPPALPFIVEGTWGSPNAPSKLEDFAPRASAFVRRIELLLADRTASPR